MNTIQVFSMIEIRAIIYKKHEELFLDTSSLGAAVPVDLWCGTRRRGPAEGVKIDWGIPFST
jgi:hypothetical protein